MRYLYFFLLACSSLAFGFIDEHSGLEVRIPEEFSLERSAAREVGGDSVWWYEFADPRGNTLCINAYYYERQVPLNYHFTNVLMDEENGSDPITLEGLCFFKDEASGRKVIVGKAHVTIDEETSQVQSFFFTEGAYGYTIDLYSNVDDPNGSALLAEILDSVTFTAGK